MAHVAHWPRLVPADVRAGVTTPLRTVPDCARTLPFREPLAVADSALRGTLLEAGLTSFEPQVRLRGRGSVVRVDLADRRRRIVLEADSFAWHGSREALALDCRRYDELVAGGWLMLRFAWEQVMFDERWVAGIVRWHAGCATASALLGAEAYPSTYRSRA